MTLKAYNQVPIPSFMYGTAWKKDDTARLAQLAVQSGFAAIDTANQLIHYDEALVGEALKALEQQGIARNALFLQTKFTSVNGQDERTPYDATADLTTQVRQSIDSSLEHLHTDYLDSYVLHGPYVRDGLSDADWQVWAAMEEQYGCGKARMIGVSNVTVEQLKLFCAQASIKPMVVQNRCYASMGWDYEVRKVCREQDIIYQGFSLLTANARVANHPVLQAAAARFGVGTAQVIFAFARQIGMLPLTGTTNAQHMVEDLQSEMLELSPDELKQIENIGQ